MNIMSFIIFILIIGLIVLVHEFGHFIMAKKFGVYVFEFSIGMGPKLFSFKGKGGETTYSIRLLPFGGFVSMAGENDTEELSKDIPKNRTLDNIKPFKKFCIMFAGVLNNFILAFIIFFLIALFKGSPSQKPIINGIELNSPAYKAGLMKNDVIERVNLEKVKTIEDVQIEMALSNGIKENTLKDITLVVKRNNKLEFINLKAGNNKKYGFNFKEERNKGIIPSLTYAHNSLWTNIRSMKRTFKALVNKKIGMEAFSGPIGVYKAVDAGKKSSAGFLYLCYLTALISVNVAYINLLPLPILDGGQILFLIIEKFLNRPIKKEVKDVLMLISTLLLISFALYVSGLDILKLRKIK